MSRPPCSLSYVLFVSFILSLLLYFVLLTIPLLPRRSLQCFPPLIVFPHLDSNAPVPRYLYPPSIFSQSLRSIKHTTILFRMPEKLFSMFQYIVLKRQQAKNTWICATCGHSSLYASKHAPCPPSLPNLSTCLYANGHKNMHTLTVKHR